MLRQRLSLDHLDRMTDSTGLIQHSIYSVPRRESGYTTDDNARALRLCARLWSQSHDDRMLSRVTHYLSFLEYARSKAGGFHNFLSYQRDWLDLEGSGDCQGQAIRALAEVAGSELPANYCLLARELIESILPTLPDLRSLRAQAYVILAWGHLWSVGAKNIEPLESVAWIMAERLLASYQHCAQPNWAWFESRLTYANAVLPHALFVAARRWPDERFLGAAQASFKFLDRETAIDGVFWPIGNSGWYLQGDDRALYDQQPLEAATMAEAALSAYDLLGDDAYLSSFQRTCSWFHGSNSLREPLAELNQGSCCDGLQVSGPNRNQGAESTLAYLWTELLHLESQHLRGQQGELEISIPVTTARRS